MSHEASKQVYADGAIHHNNPILVADQERKLLSPSLADTPPDIILSLGTSYNPDSVSIRRAKMSRTSTVSVGIISHAKSLLRIALDNLASTLDSEKTWENYLEVLSPSSQHRHRYVRLNPRLTTDPPSLDEVDKIEEIQHVVRQQMLKDPRIAQVAQHLVATSFYFEKTGQLEAQSSGFICRGKPISVPKILYLMLNKVEFVVGCCREVMRWLDLAST
jgi:hypothetical protein